MDQCKAETFTYITQMKMQLEMFEWGTFLIEDIMLHTKVEVRVSLSSSTKVIS
jgi:hypothetical protein